MADSNGDECRSRLNGRVLVAGFITLRSTEIVLLPGLDGTGKLFKRFIAAAPPECSVTSIALPMEALNYHELADHVVRNLPECKPLVAIAESFSGPLASALAQRRPIAARLLQ